MSYGRLFCCADKPICHRATPVQPRKTNNAGFAVDPKPADARPETQSRQLDGGRWRVVANGERGASPSRRKDHGRLRSTETRTHSSGRPERHRRHARSRKHAADLGRQPIRRQRRWGQRYSFSPSHFLTWGMSDSTAFAMSRRFAPSERILQAWAFRR